MKPRLPSYILGAIMLAMACGQAIAAPDKPNILVLWGDDIGQSNISTYT